MKTITESEVRKGFSKFKCDNGKQYVCRSNACPFCKYCTMVYDYTHGPYLFLCDKNGDVSKAFEGKCKLYERIK